VGGSGYSIVHTRQIVMHCSISYLKCCESLSFLVRDVVHITPENFSTCVAAIRTFVEASYRGESQSGGQSSARRVSARSGVKKTPRNKPGSVRKARTEPRHGGYEADESSDEELVGEYTHVTMQLLDLMHVLHTRAMGVQTAWERGTEDLWDMAWCPVLQGMARLCCDSRASVRTQALTLLQRSLLVPDLQVLSPSQWEFAFLRVLFPMLRKLLEMGGSKPDQGREETKLRAAMMLSKVFLQHLGPLSSLPTFTALWLTILDLVGQFCATASTDILADALPESLKNMLLVMDTSGRGLFFTESGHPTPLWGVTWGKIDTFLPGLRAELFPDWEKRADKILQVEEAARQAAANVKAEAEVTMETVNAAVNPEPVVEVGDGEVEKPEVGAGEPGTPVPPVLYSQATDSNNPQSQLLSQPLPDSTHDHAQPAVPCPISIPVPLPTALPPVPSPAPLLASLTTTAPPASTLSNYFGSIISSQPVRERNPSLPDPPPPPPPPATTHLPHGSTNTALHSILSPNLSSTWTLLPFYPYNPCPTNSNHSLCSCCHSPPRAPHPTTWSCPTKSTHPSQSTDPPIR